MRKKDAVIVWPIYFDSTKTRAEGRRVPKSLAVPSPKLEDLRKAIEQVGLETETITDAGYSRNPLRNMGYIIVAKKESKIRTLRKIAQKLRSITEKK